MRHLAAPRTMFTTVNYVKTSSLFISAKFAAGAPNCAIWLFKPAPIGKSDRTMHRLPPITASLAALVRFAPSLWTGRGHRQAPA